MDGHGVLALIAPRYCDSLYFALSISLEMSMELGMAACWSRMIMGRLVM